MDIRRIYDYLIYRESFQSKKCLIYALTAYLKVRSVPGFGVQKTLVQSVPRVLDRFSGVEKVPGVNKCGVKVVWRGTWRSIPVGKWFLTMVIVSPPSRVVPLPNGLNGLYMGAILTTYYPGWSSKKQLHSLKLAVKAGKAIVGSWISFWGMAGYVIYFSFRECKYYLAPSQDASDHQNYYESRLRDSCHYYWKGGKIHNLYEQAYILIKKNNQTFNSHSSKRFCFQTNPDSFWWFRYLQV